MAIMKSKILIIEDDETMRKVLQKRLESEEYFVIAAADGVEGVKRATTESPHLIIMDIKMPNMDGWTCMKEIRKSQNCKNTPILMLTGQDKMKDMFKLEGVADFLVKPYEKDVLFSKVKKLLSK